MIGSVNLFSYCGNNPVLFSDPHGNTYGAHYNGNGVVGYTDARTGGVAVKSVSSNTSTVSSNSTVSKKECVSGQAHNCGGGVVGYTDAGTGNQYTAPEKSQYSDKNTVHSLGVSATGGWCIDGNFGASFVWDENNNRGIAITVGMGGGLAYKASVSINGMVASDYSSVYDMQGWGVSLGSTIGYVSVESSLGNNYGLFVGGWYSSGIEFHSNISYTWIIPLGGRK